MTLPEKNKLGLIISKSVLTEDNISKYQELSYDTIYILHKWWTGIRTVGKITIIGYSDLEEGINKVYELRPDDMTLIPFFFWDVLAKNCIDIYNHEFGTQVNYSCFKDKNIINETIQSACKKRSLFFTFDQMQQRSYNDIMEQWLKKFMMKPQAWSSSLMTFLIENSDQFDAVKKELSPDFNYIIEEYFDGELNSVDFYFDGQDLYILAYVKEFSLKDLRESNVFSSKFLEKYTKDLSLFNFFIPVRYDESFDTITQEEFNFFDKLKDILYTMKYRWFIHLEYKFNIETKRIWFVERWWRLWFKRNIFIEEAYTQEIRTFDIPALIYHKNFDYFTKTKEGIYILKEGITNTNILWMRTTFYQKTTKDFSTLSSFTSRFSSYLKKFFSTKFSVSIKDIKYIIKYEEENIFYPFYQSNTTRLDYLLSFHDKDFSLIKEHIGEIVECLIFNDFTP